MYIYTIYIYTFCIYIQYIYIYTLYSMAAHTYITIIGMMAWLVAVHQINNISTYVWRSIQIKFLVLFPSFSARQARQSVIRFLGQMLE
jgi:hypothetical protein